MFKKWFIICSILGLSACVPAGDSSSTIEREEETVVSEVIEQPELEEEIEITPPILVVTRVSGLEDALSDFLSEDFTIVASLEGIELTDYERILVLYDNRLYLNIPPTELEGPRLGLFSLISFFNQAGVDITMLYLGSSQDYIDFFSKLDESIYEINQETNVYDLYPLEGKAIYVDSSIFDRSKLTTLFPDALALSDSANEMEAYLKEELYVFLSNAIPSFLSDYSSQIMSLNRSVTTITTERGQRIVVGRATGPLATLFYDSFVDGIQKDNPTSYPLMLAEREGRSIVPAEYCYLKEYRNPSSPGQPYSRTTVSHQISPKRVNAQGTKNALAILVAFDEYPLPISSAQYQSIVKYANDVSMDYFDVMSDGQFDLVWHYYPTILSVPSFRGLTLGPESPDYETSMIEHVEDLLVTVEESMDLTEIDLINVYWPVGLPSSVYGGLSALSDVPLQTQQGEIYNFSVKVLTDSYLYNPDILARSVYHGVAHNLGLTDLYLFQFQPENLGRTYHYKYGHWDMMTNADGELNAWHRWILGWIPDDQVNCVPYLDDTSYEITIQPLNESASDTRIAVIALSDSKAISIELRGPGPYCSGRLQPNTYYDKPTGGCSQNILVSVIDSSIENGLGPMQILRPERSTAEDYRDALLLEGEFVTYENITITHIQRDDDESVVKIVVN